MSLRSDNWASWHDKELAEIVLTHIKTGKTQLQAFEEAGRKLGRTAQACGFRWNKFLRQKYTQAFEHARKEMLEKKLKTPFPKYPKQPNLETVEVKKDSVEWLTTGQMIDAVMTQGLEAESKDGLKVKWDCGLLVDYRGSGWEKWAFTTQDRERKWRLLPKQPKYILFSEAMKAVEEGKNIVCHFKKEVIEIISYNNKINAICEKGACSSGGGASISIAWIVAGKWFIKE